MSELRQDRTSGAWTIIAPARGKRPHDHPHGGDEDGSASSANCPFCPGHETVLPGIVDEIAGDGSPGWRVRSVPNLYPAVGVEDFTPLPHSTGHRTMDGYGRHEVIIESPLHDTDLTDFDPAQLDAVASMYHRRYLVLEGLPKIETVVLCRNHGARAGASLRHPHSQIIALATVPQRIRSAANWARGVHRETGHCATCLELAAELREGTRIVEETDGFAVLVPFAAAAPFEFWIVPKRHAASFATLDVEELAGFMHLLQRSIGRLKQATGSWVAYNFVVDSAPKNLVSAPHMHWKLRLRPALAIPGGFELGTDLPINPSSPETDAEALRASLGGTWTGTVG